MQLVSEHPQCTAVTRKGSPCPRESVPHTDPPVCALHLPSTLAGMRDAARRGGKLSGLVRSKRAAERKAIELQEGSVLLRSGLDLSSVTGMRALLDHAAALLLRDAPGADKRASAIGSLISRAIEIEDSVGRAAEVEELRQQVAAVVNSGRRRRLPAAEEHLPDSDESLPTLHDEDA